MKNKILNFFDYDLKQLLHNVSWQFLSQIVVSLVTFLKVIIITRHLSLSEYGQYVIILAFLSILHLFFKANIGSSSIKFYTDFTKRKEKKSILALIKLNFYILSILLILYLITTSILTNFIYEMLFDKEDIYIYIILYALLLSFEYYGEILIALLRFYDKFKQSAIIFIITSIVELTLLFFISININNSFENILIAIMVSRFTIITLRLIISWILIKKELIGISNTPLIIIKEDIRRYIFFIFNNSLSRLVTTASKRGDILILGYLTGKESVAIYDIAKKLAFTLYTIKSPLEISIMPQLAKFTANYKINELKIFLFKLSKISILFSLFIYLLFYLIREDLISIIFGQEYILAKDYFIILLFAVLIEFTFFWITPLYISLGKVKERLKIVTFSTLFSFLCSYFLVIYFGAIGMSYTILISISLIYSISVWFIFFKINTFKKVRKSNEKQ